MGRCGYRFLGRCWFFDCVDRFFVFGFWWLGVVSWGCCCVVGNVIGNRVCCIGCIGWFVWLFWWWCICDRFCGNCLSGLLCYVFWVFFDSG